MFNQELKNEDLFDELVEEPAEIDIIDDDVNMIEEHMTPKKENPITESELFDLIDSMYEKGE